MEFSVGTIVEGKVTGITRFGAFVSLAPNKSGLVHISEVANTYVNDISEHLQVGQEVKVKILSIDDNERINLSIKKAEPPQSRPQRQNVQRTQPRSFTPEPKEPSSFEEKLKQFMADSDSKMSGIKQYSDRKSASRRRK